MLVDVKLYGDSQRLSKGVYLSPWFNFELDFRGRQQLDLDYPEFTNDGCYGVCDSPEQLLDSLIGREAKGSEKMFVISVVPIRKEEQPEAGGWRWHKWGEYIGEQQPTTEYLYDEPLIDLVYAYHIYQVEPAQFIVLEELSPVLLCSET